MDCCERTYIAKDIAEMEFYDVLKLKEEQVDPPEKKKEVLVQFYSN